MDDRYASKIVEFAEEQIDPTRIALDLMEYNFEHYQTSTCEKAERGIFSCDDFKPARMATHGYDFVCMFQLSKNVCLRQQNYGRVNSNGAYVNSSSIDKTKRVRFGWQLLQKIFLEATNYRCNFSDNDYQQLKNPAQWCGIFATWIWQNADEANLKVWWNMPGLRGLSTAGWKNDMLVRVGKSGGKWVLGYEHYNYNNGRNINFISNEMRVVINKFLKKGPGVGDIGIRKTKVPEHYFVITNVSNGLFDSIDGNSDNVGIVANKNLSIDRIIYYYTVININYEYFELCKELSVAMGFNAEIVACELYIEGKDYKEEYERMKQEIENLENAKSLNDDLESNSNKFDEWQIFR